jgi:hypothetical protein
MEKREMTLREVIQKAKHEQDKACKERSPQEAREIREVFEALDPDSEMGNPNVDSAINALVHDFYLALGDVETRQLLTVDVLARKWAVTWFRIGRRAEQLMQGKHPNGRE